MRVDMRWFALFVFLFSACGGPKPDAVDKVAGTSANAASTPKPLYDPKNGDYPGKGKVTKIQPGVVELKHEEIRGFMPAMQMEFYLGEGVSLKDIKVGDDVDFTLRFKDGQETIVAISKPK